MLVDDSIIKQKISKHHQKNKTTDKQTIVPDHEVVGLPALSPSVETSKIVEWKKKEGDFVEANEAIAVVQTDKAELDWQVTDDVYLAKILLEPGETVPVGTDCCIFVDNESDIAPFANYSGSGSGASSSGGGGAPEAPAQETQPSAPAPSGGGGGGGSSLPANRMSKRNNTEK